MAVQACHHEGPIGSDNVITNEPAKREALAEYIQSLPITDDSEQNRELLIESLHRAQSIFGYLPESVQLFVADRLKLHLSEVYGVISFYSYFTDQPVGKHRINVCTGTACFVKGAGKILEEFERLLGIEDGQTSDDKRFSLGSLRCVGACSLAPVVMVNDKVYGNVTAKMVPDIIGECD